MIFFCCCSRSSLDVQYKKFNMLYFQYPFFKTSFCLWLLSLMHVLFRRVLFNSQIVGDFTLIILLFNSNLTYCGQRTQNVWFLALFFSRSVERPRCFLMFPTLNSISPVDFVEVFLRASLKQTFLYDMAVNAKPRFFFFIILCCLRYMIKLLKWFLYSG